MTIEQLKQRQAELRAHFEEIQSEMDRVARKAQDELDAINTEFLKIQGVIEYLEKQAK